MEIVKMKGNGLQLPPLDSFILAYFLRNTIYLHSSYVLASMGFVWPSMNLQRTVYETILRSYFFIVNPEEAALFYENLQTETYPSFMKKRHYYAHSYLCEQLYEQNSQGKERRFYEMLCVSAHAEFRGLLLDFPAQNKAEIEDRLRMVLMLSYGNIQMFAELFLDRFNEALRKLTIAILRKIVASNENQIPLFEPDKASYSSKLILRKGNFVQVISRL